MYNLGQYVPRQSPVHSQDPRTKIIAVIALSIIVMQMNSIGLLVVTSIIIACSQLANIPAALLLKTLRPTLPFFFFLFLIYILFSPGIPLFSLGPIQISYQGLSLGIIQVGKFILLVLAASVLTMSTTSTEITMGLERLLRPIKIIGLSSYDIAMMVTLALRFVPTLIEEMNSINDAQLSRNRNFNPYRISGKIRAVTYLAIPLAVSIFRRCDELVDAMEARGYHQGPRTYLRELVLTRLDFCLIGIIFMGTGLCLFI